MERKQGKKKLILKSSLAANAGHYAVLFWSVLSSPVQRDVIYLLRHHVRLEFTP
jgi:hypothetical protein